MTPVARLRTSPRVRAPRVEGAGRRACHPPGTRLTLDALVSGAWSALGADAPVVCPVCDGVMVPVGGGGECGSCRTRLD